MINKLIFWLSAHSYVHKKRITEDFPNIGVAIDLWECSRCAKEHGTHRFHMPTDLQKWVDRMLHVQ